MKALSIIKEYILSTCAFFSFFVFVIFAIGTQVTTFNDAITFGVTAIIFLFSAMVTGANYVFKLKNLGSILKLLIHFFLLAICFFGLFTAVGSISIEDGIGDVFVMFVIYLAMYTVIAGGIFGFKRLIGVFNKNGQKKSTGSSQTMFNKKSSKGRSEEYRSQFSSKK